MDDNLIIVLVAGYLDHGLLETQPLRTWKAYGNFKL